VNETTWHCTRCPDFSVIDPGLTTSTETTRDGWWVSVTRPLWELEMVRHWRDRHPAELAALGSALATTLTDERVEEMVRENAQAALERFTSRPY